MKTRVATVLAATAVLLSFEAQAQTTPTAPAPTANAPVQTASIAPSAEQLAEAKDRFQKGLRFYENEEYRLALDQFDRAYALSQNYRILFNIGQVASQLNLYARAATTLRRYLDAGKDEIPAERRAQVEKDLKYLADRTALTTITTNIPGAEIFVDEVSVGKTPLEKPVLLDAGQRVIRASAPDYETTTRVVVLVGADASEVALKLEKKNVSIVVAPPPEKSNVAPIVAWSAAGVFGAGAIVSGILSLNAQSNLKALREAPYYVSNSEFDSTKTKAQTYALVTDLTAGAALVSGGLAVYFMLRKEAPKEAARASTSLRVSPTGAFVTGTF